MIAFARKGFCVLRICQSRGPWRESTRWGLQVATSWIAEVRVWPKGPNISWRWAFESHWHRLFWAVHCWSNLWSGQLTTSEVPLSKRLWKGSQWHEQIAGKLRVVLGLVPNFPWNINGHHSGHLDGRASINQYVNHWSHVKSLKELLHHSPIWQGVSYAISVVLRQRFPEEVEQGYLGLELCWCAECFFEQVACNSRMYSSE